MTQETIAYQPKLITKREWQYLRLLLSTYQDGSGQNDGGSTPGWRDFERSVALTLNGTAQESKAIFDVLVPRAEHSGTFYGIACKMRGTLTDTEGTGRVTLEVSNSARRFWDALNAKGFSAEQYGKAENATPMGQILLELVDSWNQGVSTLSGKSIDLSYSSYLVLSYSKATRRQASARYQLHQFLPLLPDPSTFIWQFPINGKRLIGSDVTGRTVIEWYGESGGQLKYYPLVSSALWQSPVFELEAIQSGRSSISEKAALYFPDLWKRYQL